MKSFQISHSLKVFLSSCVFIGFTTLLVGFVFFDQARVWHSFLVSSLFVLLLSLGGLFFTAIQHVSSAGWSVNIRRFMEAFTGYLPIGCFCVFLLLFSGHSLYEWFDSEVVAQDSLLVHKSSYLNKTFFLIRTIVFSAIWIGFSKVLVNLSLKQDKTGSTTATTKMVRVSIAFLIFFALSLTFFSVDTVMSLEPHWFSTVFGVYIFTGLFQSFVAALILILIYFMKQGYLKDTVNENHLHDLGKYLLGCTILWAYIAFSQYMLTWYANLPEETIYYTPRSENDWMWVSLALLVFKFAVPFLFLLPRWVKRSPEALILVSVWVLIMQYVDIYWMVYPSYDKTSVHFGWIELGVLIGFIGLLLSSVFYFLSRYPLVPVKDPRKEESFQHKVTY